MNSCPFCGSDPDGNDLGEISPGKFAVSCPECECMGPIAPDPQTAIDAWNERDES